jgi:hypothetical protein
MRESKLARMKLEEAQKHATETEQEDLSLVESANELITGFCEDNGLFCGVILTPKDIGAIVELMLEKRENIKIGFKLYFTDND